MKVLNKTEQIAHSEGRSGNAAIQYMLMGYRSTPHPATGYCPYEALMKRNVRTKLDYDSFSISRNYHKMEKEITNRDKKYKQKWDHQQSHPKVEKHQFKIGDRVLLKKRKQNKWSPAFEKKILQHNRDKRIDNRGKEEIRWTYHAERCFQVQAVP